ncbi:MAG: hypothetical protein ACUVTO_06955 [Candidatus Caldatribacteriaceae bacterium]
MQEFPKKCILHGFHEGQLFYYLGEKPNTRALSLATQKERVFPGLFVLVAEGGVLVTREEDVLRIFDVEGGELLLSEPTSRNAQVLSLGDVVLVPTLNAQQNFSGYFGFAVHTRGRFALPSLSRVEDRVFFPEQAGHSWETRHAFSGAALPILRQ